MSLGAPTATGLITAWSLQPVAIVTAVAATGWYVWARHRLLASGGQWPGVRTAAYLAGVALFVWSTCGYLQVYAQSLYWAWTTQVLVLLLAVPVLILVGRPAELARRAARPTSGRFGGFFGNPLVGPALVPFICVLLLFGPVPGWAAEFDAVDWVLPLIVVALGAAVAAPLLSIGQVGTSLAVGVASAVLLVELLVDAVPGIVLRLRTTAASTFFAHRHLHLWSPLPLHDQQIGGSILWCVAESADLPLLVAIFVAWVHVDAREAREVDAVLTAERAMRGPAPDAATDDAGEPTADPVWWLADPSMRDRFRRG